MADLSEAEREKLLREDIARLGGRLTDVLHAESWPFMPHFGSADLADGVLGRIEAMQGENRTYHAGSLLGFELIETNVAYARDLVRRGFPPVTLPVPEAGPRTGAAHAAAHPDGPTAAEIRTWLTARTAALLGIPEPEVEPGRDLEDYGLDSMAAAELQADLADWLGRPVAPTLLYEHGTLEAVAAHLSPGR